VRSNIETGKDTDILFLFILPQITLSNGTNSHRLARGAVNLPPPRAIYNSALTQQQQSVAIDASNFMEL
jgi:hypothetical protein